MPLKDPDARREYNRVYHQTHLAQAAARRAKWTAEHPTYDRDHYAAHKEQEQLYRTSDVRRTAMREYMRAYRQKHPEMREAQRARDAARYASNRQAELERGRRWASANPEKNAERAMRRYARLKGATVENVDYPAILDGWICYLCGEPIEPDAPRARCLSFDHVVPLSRGGEHSMANLRPAHLGCNSRKGTKVHHV